MHFENGSYQGRQVRRPISPYQYSPLSTNDNEIRLVELDIAASRSNRIIGSIVHYPLRDPPAFVALSYGWGNPERYVTLTLDNIIVPATINLASALRQLLKHGCTRIWIDALCIDQQNGAERSAQILRMEAVYKKAHTVAVWVGPKTDGSFRVMQFAENFGRTRLGSPKTVHRIKPSHLEPIADEVKAFFRRSYWTRVWIIQEIVAASRLRVLCGPDIVDWTPFSIFVSALPEKIQTTRSSMSLADAGMAKKISQFRRDRVDGGSISMLQALHLSSLSDFTDPKDKVFALLGLSFDRMVYVAEPTYNWSERELCIRMTTSFFESKRSLDIVFLGPGNQTSSLGLPSWCPRYTKFASDPDLHYVISYISGQDQKYRIGVKGRRWNTTGTSVIANSLLDSSNHLLLTAWPIGKVAALSRRHGGDSHHYDPRLRYNRKPSDGHSSTNEALTRVLFLLYNDDYERHLHEIDGLVAWWRGQHGEHIARPEAFLSLLYNFDSDDLKREKLAYQFESIKRWRHLHRKFSINGKTLSFRCPKQALGQRMGESGVKYQSPRLPTPDLKGSLSALSSIIDEGLRLMTTDRGDVGWAHRDAGIRDEMFLVSGCSMPMILRSASRESGGAYKVVGHAYVDGFMDGEAWSKARTRDMVDLRIC